MSDTILGVFILFSPLFFLCAVTIIIEGSQRISDWFDRVDARLDARIADGLERMFR